MTAISNLMDCYIVNLTDDDIEWQTRQKPSAFRAALQWLLTGRESDIQGLTKRCMESPIVTIKTIRLNVIQIPELLARYPNARIIYYTRDPRGILSSRKQIDSTGYKPSAENSGALCSKMASDIKMIQDLSTKYPGNLLWVRFEDLALHPHNVTRRMYEAHGLGAVPPEVRRWLRESTTASAASPRNQHLYGTVRNSPTVVNKWRSKLTPDEISTVNSQCSKLLDLLESSVS